MSPVILTMVLALGALVLLAVGLMLKSERHIMLERVRKYGFDEATQAPILAEELLPPFVDRIMRPALGKLAKMVKDTTAAQAADVARRRLDAAGKPMGLNPLEFHALKILALAAGAVIGIGMGFAVQTTMTNRLLLFVVPAAIGYFAPEKWLSGRIARRRNEIQRALPNAIDLLNVSVEAGLGFDAAIARITDKTTGPLADEFGIALQEMKLGKARVDALHDMADRSQASELSGFVAAVYQAEQLGASLTTVLRVQAQSIRARRRMTAREIAAKLPVKMLFPLVFLIFPSIFIVVLGPGVIQLSKTFLAK